MLAIAPQSTLSVAPTSLEASRENQAATVSSTVLNTLNIHNALLQEFCTEKLQNICSACADPSQAAQDLAANISSLLAQAGEVTEGNAAKFEVVGRLTNHLLGSLTNDDLTKARDAAIQVNTHFNCDVDSQGKTRLDDILNALELPYHKATHESGRLGHAREMESDVRHFFEDHPLQDLAGMLALVHDHVQIKDQGMGVGNARHWGLNEIATAAALSTLAKEAGIDDAGQEALLRVAGATIPAGTAFNFLPGVGGGGKPGLGTTIEGMLRSDALPVERGEASTDLIAMAYTLAICDTQRNNLAGLARPTDEVIFKNAPDPYRLLSNCAEKDPEGFGAIFFDNGKLSEAGLALCSKLTSTIEVFEEFPPITFSTPMIEDGKPNNPLSKAFDSGSLSTEERDHAILELISKNGSFGSSDVAGDIESFAGVFSHQVLEKMKNASLLKDPTADFIKGYQAFSGELKTECELKAVRLEDVLKQMKSMGGSVSDGGRIPA